jgi:VCBS repeat-containing protein
VSRFKLLPLTGFLQGDEYRSFFIFDKSIVPSSTSLLLTGASLFFPSQFRAFTGSADTKAFQIKAVTADTATLVGGTAGISGFQALNSGNLLGSYNFVNSSERSTITPVPRTPFQISLNSSGLSYINNSATQFAFGGSIPNLTNERIFGFSDGTPVRLQLVYGDSSTGAVMEDANPTSLTTTGTLSISDPDAGQAKFNTVVETTVGNLGSLSISDVGGWSYNVSNGAVQYLGAGQTKIETFTVKSLDGTASQAVTITINGQNDAAVITGDSTGSINESTTTLLGTTTTGSLTYTDLDTTDNNGIWFIGSGSTAHGSYVLTNTGAWTYTLSNNNTAVNALNVGGSFVDTFVATTIDGTTQTVSVTINGSNDAAIISGVLSGQVTEASGLNNEINNILTNSRATGTVTYTDVDNAGTAWVATTEPLVTASQKGSYSINAAGTWVYDLNNNYGDVQALQAGQSTTDTFTITTTGGTTQTVTVIITGGNDLPTVTNLANLSGAVIEAGGVANGTLNTPSVSKDLNFTDPDNTNDVWNSGSGSGTYGTYSIDPLGQWTYNLNNSNATVQALNSTGTNTSLVDTFSVTTNDNTTQTVSVTIHGSNDAAIIGGFLSGQVTEASGLNNAIAGTGSLIRAVTVSDVDSIQTLTTVNSQTSLNGYGTYFTDSSSNRWRYDVKENNAIVQALNVGQSITDSFTVSSIDETTQTINIVIQGANDEALVTGDINNKSVTENSGFSNNVVGTPTVTGNLAYTDVDDAGSAWRPQTDVFTGNFGLYSINAAGAWTYTINNNNGTVDGLQNGQSITDSFVVTTAGDTTQTVTVTILGVNDSAIVTGQTTAALNESGVFTVGAATGNNLNYTDPDNIADGWRAVLAPTLATGGHGNYTINADGVWSYSLLTGNPIVESLAAGVTTVDTFVATTTDGTTQVVSITITGQNDAAIITNAGTAPSGAAFGSVTEAGGVANAISGTPTVSKNLDSTDVDAGQNDVWTIASGIAGNGYGYGDYVIAADGQWTYTVNNTNITVQGLNAGQSITDTFLATTIDSSASRTVTVTINGANDTATILNGATAASGSVTEAGGLSNATPGTTATDNLNSSDVDGGQNDSWTVVTTPSTNNATYGKYTISSAGVWNYAADQSNIAVQALNLGTSITDSFVVSTFDGSASQTVTVTINGTNDTAVVTSLVGDASGSVTENGGLNNAVLGTSTTTGNLAATDVDAGQNDKWTVVPTPSTNNGTYGKYSIDLNGVWSYAVDNSLIEGLNVGTSFTDSFVAYTIDNSASQTVTVTIKGTDDAATFTNFTGSVTEAGGTANGTPGVASVTNTLIVADVDNTYPGWTGQNVTGTYGTFTLAPCVGPVVSATHADWTYTLNDSDPDTQALKLGQSVTETFTAVNGGASQVVTITIVGTNDNPALTGSASAIPLTTIAENAAPYTITTAQLLQGFSDVDAGQTATLSIANLTSPQGTFTLSGATYTFVPTNLDYNGVVNLVYNVKDASNGVYAATSSFTITPVNDAPTALSTTASLASVDEDTTNPAGATVGSLFGSIFSDAKDIPANTFAGVAITRVTSNSEQQGLWQWLDVNNAWQAISSVSTSGALFLNTATKIRFLPVGDFNGVPGSIEARLVEPGALNFVGHPVTTGDLTNVSGLNSGGTTHVSDSPNTVVLSTSINPIDDPTTITGNTSGTVTEDTAISFVGSLVATDPDVSGPLFISVTNQNGANNYGKFTILNNGTWQYNLDNNNPLVQHLGAANSLTDTYTFNTTTGASQTVSVTINGSIDAGVSITGTSANEVINGKDGSDFLSGGDGNDSLIGGLGNDVLTDYGDGSDTLVGGVGDDVYAVVSSGDTVVENINEGTDTVWTGINYTLTTNVENLILVGSISGTGNDGNNLIIGYGEGDNFISGGDGDDTLLGGLGNDTIIDYGNGADMLAGGVGDDVYAVVSSGDTVVENINEGTDTVWVGIDYTLTTNVENLILVGSITGTGNDGNNLIIGYGEGDNFISGGDGNDTLFGGLGNDTVFDYGNGVDILAGGVGDDVYAVVSSGDTVVENINEGIDTVWVGINYALTTNVENLILVGSITGTGNDGNNLIIGYGVGDNTIEGGAGADTLIGGEGADDFVFNFGDSSFTATDRILDFNFGTDKIKLLSAPAGIAALPSSFTRVSDDATSTNLSTLAQGVYSQGLGLGGAALVVSTGVGIAGTYLVIDDGTSGFGGGDLVINITGSTNTPSSLGSITPVSSFFKV